MIKPINITPINTATHAYFHCINCGAKEEITISLLNTDNNFEMEIFRQIKCPYCGVSLGTTGLPKLDNLEIIQLSKQLFLDKGDTHPTLFYMDLLFNDRSPHSKSKKFSERIESLAQFLTDKGRNEPNDFR